MTKAKSSKKKIFIWVASPLLLISVTIAALPAFLSTKTGKKGLLFIINRSLPGILTIEKLSLCWRGPQEITRLTYHGKQDEIDVTCPSLSLTAPLTNFLFKPYAIGTLEIVEPKVKINPGKLIPLRSPPQVKAASFLLLESYSQNLTKDLLLFKGQIHLKQGTLETLTPESVSVAFNHIDCLFNLEDEASLTLKAETTWNGSQGNISIDSLFKMNDNLDFSLKGTCTHFPVEGADQILALFAPLYSGLSKEALGPYLDLTCTASFSKNLCEAALFISSDNLKANLEMTSKEGKAELSAPALVQVILTPSLFEKAAPLFTGIVLPIPASPLTLMLTLDKLSLPIKESGPLLEKASFAGKISTSSYKIKDDLIAKISGEFSSTNLTEELDAQITLSLTVKNQIANINSTLAIKEPLSIAPKINSSTSIQKIPTALLDSFSITKSPLSDLLGTSIDGSIVLSGDLKNATASISITTPLLEITKSSFTLNGLSLSLSEPTSFTYQLQPAVLDHFLENKNIALAGLTTLSGTLAKCKIADLSKQGSLELEATLNTSPISFKKLFELNEYTIAPLKGEFKIDSLSKITFTLKGEALSLESEWKIKEEMLILKTPLLIQYTLKDKDLELLILDKERPHLIGESQILIIMAPSKFPLDGNLRLVNVQSDISIKELKLENSKKTTQMTFQDCTVSLLFSGAKDSLSFSGGGAIASTGPIPSKISYEGLLQKVLTAKDYPPIRASCKIENLPIDLIDQLLTLDIPLEPLIGSNLNMTIQMEKTNDVESLAVDAKSPLLSLKGSFSLQTDQLLLSKGAGPFTLEYELTPNGYRTLSCLLKGPEAKKDLFTLKESTSFKASILELNIPCKGAINLTDTFIKASIENKKMNFEKIKTKEDIFLLDSKISLQKTSKEKTLSFSLDTFAEVSSLAKGRLHIDADIDQFQDLSKASTTLHATASQFPSTVLDIAIPIQKDFFLTLLGSSFDVNADLTLKNSSGPFSLNLSSSESKIRLAGRLDNGILTLKENAKAEVALSPKTSKLFLNKENSPSIRSISTSSPVKVEIGAQGFSFPLNDFSFEQLEMPWMQVNIGKIRCQNKGNINLALKLLKSKNSNSKDLDLWVAPLDIHVHKGIIEVERTEVLVSELYDVAFWGEINQPKDSVNMVLGITAQTLQDTLGLKGLPDDYLLKIPVKGTLNNVELSTTIASSKIAALLLWQNKALQGSLGPFGQLLKIIPPPGGEGKTPPAKTPFPWQR